MPRLLALLVFSLLSALAAPSHGLDAEALGSCTPGPEVLCLLDGRFSVEVDWQDFDVNTGAGQVLPFAADGFGFFYFTDSEQPELLVQMVDGTAINDHFWVFIGALTNWQYTVTVTDTVTSEQAVYFNPLGSFTSVRDVEALPEAPPRPGAAGAPGRSSLGAFAVTHGPGPPTECQPTATTLCLDDGRFSVEVEWMDFTGGTGSGMATPVTDLGGYFFFFTPQSANLAVKIHDGGDGFYWFFYGALTDVEYTITVTDVCTGAQKTYFDPLGDLTSAGDFTAFAATPSCTAPIFEDGFESGDTSLWSQTTPP